MVNALAMRVEIAIALHDNGEYSMLYPFDESGFYAIQVAGEVDESWPDRLGGMTLMRSETEGPQSKPVTVLIGLVADQAALFGVLTTLYEHRYPLLYVKYLGTKETTKETGGPIE